MRHFSSKNELTYLDADYQAVDAAIVAAEKLNKDDYKDFSKVEAAINAVVRGKILHSKLKLMLWQKQLMMQLILLKERGQCYSN